MRLIKRPVVQQKTGKSKSQIYDDMAKGRFPKPVPTGEHSVAWVEAEIDQWIADRIAARDAEINKRV